jgi:dynein intermediate chain
MYKSTLHNSQANEEKYTIYEGHNGPITGLSINNPSSEYSALSGLVLSSSFDWSVKLWSPKHKSYIRSFDNSDDYIYDVDWNPSNPGLFGCVNNEGYIDLWDLTSDVEVPLVHYKVNKFAINKCKWNRDGSKIMTGDSEGSVNVFDLDRKYQHIEGGRLDDLENTLM